jgi:hypothetical protein
MQQNNENYKFISKTDFQFNEISLVATLELY